MWVNTEFSKLKFKSQLAGCWFLFLFCKQEHYTFVLIHGKLLNKMPYLFSGASVYNTPNSHHLLTQNKTKIKREKKKKRRQRRRRPPHIHTVNCLGSSLSMCERRRMVLRTAQYGHSLQCTGPTSYQQGVEVFGKIQWILGNWRINLANWIKSNAIEFFYLQFFNLLLHNTICDWFEWHRPSGLSMHPISPYSRLRQYYGTMPVYASSYVCI